MSKLVQALVSVDLTSQEAQGSDGVWRLCTFTAATATTTRRRRRRKKKNSNNDNDDDNNNKKKNNNTKNNNNKNEKLNKNKQSSDVLRRLELLWTQLWCV
ncbi:unnamed protein product [Polarella glacialis]|uniref:Uncharacterized protein n=1 Tax=Polarella glacialis TaxID=89957 RepID=A0A813JZR1_POLGL|nr:unnamed protein product [Polarella glacialis]